VEDGDAAEGAGGPFRVVFGEVWVDGFEERPNEGCFPRRTDNGALAVDVHDCAAVSKCRRIECMVASYIDRMLLPSPGR
jgi:hypothetical protein